MADIETDYLVVGAGASAMSFVDSILANSDREVVLVDRRHRPGGHWLDAYPFVRLHQPSANYGVAGRPLGTNRIETEGLNEGFYEQASAHEICDHYHRALDEDFLPTGRVRFLGVSNYVGADGDRHRIESLLSGEATTVRVRRKLVDATYVASDIPSRHTPGFGIGDGVRFVTPNQLVDLQEPAPRFTLIGAGKTAADTCLWLQENGIPSDAIRWIKPREPWIINREYAQPLEKVGSSFMRLQAFFMEAAASATDPHDFTRRLEDLGAIVRADRGVEPTMFKGSTMAPKEIDRLREVDDVVRLGHVRNLTTTSVELADGTVPAVPGEVFVDCTAEGVRAVEPKPLFEPDRLTLEFVTLGVVPWSAATLGYIEATRDDDAEKNRLCPPVTFNGRAEDMIRVVRAGLRGTGARGAEPDFAAWSNGLRLNPAMGVGSRPDDVELKESMARIAANRDEAMANLSRLLD
jgi:hypothetical protein